MLETFIAFIVATFAGTVAGIFPGVNVFVTLTVLYPFLITLDPVNIILVYVVICSMDQYFGSVSGTFFAIPGSMTSIPSVQEGHALLQNKQGDKAIMYSAIGSFIGSMFAVCASLALIQYIDVFYIMFDTRIKAILLTTSLIILSLISKNKIAINLALMTFGFSLGHVGIDLYTNTSFATFGITELSSGLPLLSVVLGIYLIPYLIKNIQNHKQLDDFDKITFSGYIQTFKSIYIHKYILIRSSIIGYLSGFVPGLTFHLGTILSYTFERRKQEKEGTYERGNIQSLLAAETSNNAGIFSSLIPLIMIGIPITASQAMLYDIITNGGIDTSIATFQPMLYVIAIAYTLSALLGMYIAGKYVNWISIITRINTTYMYATIILVLLLTLLYIGYSVYQPFFYIAVTLTLLPIGMLTQKYDKIPLIYAFILHDPIYYGILTINALYF